MSKRHIINMVSIIVILVILAIGVIFRGIRLSRIYDTDVTAVVTDITSERKYVRSGRHRRLKWVSTFNVVYNLNGNNYNVRDTKKGYKPDEGDRIIIHINKSNPEDFIYDDETFSHDIRELAVYSGVVLLLVFGSVVIRLRRVGQ